MQNNTQKCNNADCKLKDTCKSYQEEMKTLASWLNCKNYSNFESTDIQMQEYKRNKLNDFLTENNLQKDKLNAEETAKVVDYISRLQKEIVDKSLQK